MSYENAKNKYMYALSKHDMLKGHKRVLVGFSGGSDSSLLLFLLKNTDGIEAAAAHLNHGIRGEEADRDERFCKEFCLKHNVPFFVQHSNVPKIASESKTTVEEAARNERYSFFDRICREHGYELIATAHNADDNLETVIFNLARGSSLDGLCGIPPARDNIIRPLICLTKAEINAACKDAEIDYVVDSTNLDSEYTRNFIRHQIIPKLKEINDGVVNTVLRTSETLSLVREHLNDLCEKYSFQSGRDVLGKLDDALLSRVIKNEVENNGGSADFNHINTLIRAIRSGKSHIKTSVTGLNIVCDRNQIYIDNPYLNVAYEIPLKTGSNIINDNFAYYVCGENGGNVKDINTLKNVYKFSIQVKLNSAKISNTCIIRNRRSGDTYRYSSQTHKVKKLLQSLKLPLSYANNLPFIVNDGEILYIPHFKVSDSALTDSDSITVYFFANTDINEGNDYEN